MTMPACVATPPLSLPFLQYIQIYPSPFHNLVALQEQFFFELSKTRDVMHIRVVSQQFNVTLFVSYRGILWEQWAFWLLIVPLPEVPTAWF
jgi:hypothetical protein